MFSLTLIHSVYSGARDVLPSVALEEGPSDATLYDPQDSMYPSITPWVGITVKHEVKEVGRQVTQCKDDLQDGRRWVRARSSLYQHEASSHQLLPQTNRAHSAPTLLRPHVASHWN